MSNPPRIRPTIRRPENRLRFPAALRRQIFGFALATLLGVAASPPALAGPPVLDCVPEKNARPICGFTNPEDMVVLPGNGALIVGEYGQSADHHSGNLVVFDLATETRTIVYGAGAKAGVGVNAAETGWGDDRCTDPPTSAFNSHGIDLVRRNDGRLALLVVQHGGREAIEFFEVEENESTNQDGASWKVTWRGCVPAPPDASLNEVAALPNGNFYTTKMASLAGALDFSAGMPTENTGEAYAWSATSGFRKIDGTGGIMPNGIATSPDGRFIYMNASGDNSIRKIEVVTGRELGRATVGAPDNVTWAPDGRLLVASVGGLDPADFESCLALSVGACGTPFEIIAVDPKTMTSLGPVYKTEGRPMGAGTVGLQVGTELFVGSFKGDRILRIDLTADD